MPNKKIIKKKLLRNTFWSFILIIANTIGSLVFTAVLARFLMPRGYGIYTLTLSIAMIFYTFADLGINETLVRYISSSLEKDKKRIASYYRYLLKIKLVLTISVSVLLLIFAYPLSFFIFKTPQLFLPLIIISVYIVVLSLEGFYSQFYYTVEKVGYNTFKEFLLQVLRIGLVFLVFFILDPDYYLIGILIALIFTSSILLCFNLYYSKKLVPELSEKPTIKINKSKVRAFVIFLTIGSISSIFFSYIDSIILGIFLPLEYVGYYKAAFSLVIGIIGFVSFPSNLLLPLFSKVEESTAEEVFYKTIKYLSIIIIPSIFGLLILGKYIIVLLYGPLYLNSVLPLYFLSFLIFPAVFIKIFLAFFSSKEKPQIFAKLILIASLINIILNILLIKVFLRISPLWGVAGAAIATIFSWFFYFIASIRASKNELNFKFSFQPIFKPLSASIIMAIVLISLNSFIDDMTLIIGIGEIILGILTYFAVMILIKGVTKEDFNLLKTLLKVNESD